MEGDLEKITNCRQKSHDHHVFVNNRFYKGLMLRVDDEWKEVHVVEIGACRGINMHFEWGPWLNLSLIHRVRHVYE
jgi:hypothetical protein